MTYISGTRFFPDIGLVQEQIFGPFSKYLQQKKHFLENLALSLSTSYGFLASYQNLEKTNDAIPRKNPERGRKDNWKNEQKDGQTLFHRILLGTARGPKTKVG